MKSRITKNDARLIGGVYVVLIIAGIAAWYFFREAAIIPFAATCLRVALLAQFEGVRRTSEQLDRIRSDAFDDYRQVESLLSLHASLRAERPLPPLRDHAASPDLIAHAVSRMLTDPPELVVELGSGSSTVFLALCLERLGRGKLISIDHDAQFAERTRAMLDEHGLSEHATVLHLPLEKVIIGGREFLWYAVGDLRPDVPIDFLFIDGPPYHVHPLARYPALPLMLPLLARDASIIFDDANRPEELKIAAMWREEFRDLAIETLPAEKGALLIRRRSQD